MSNSSLVSGLQMPNSSSANPSITEDPNSSDNVKPVSIFSNDYKKNDDLRLMLDSNKDNLKLDAMKRIVGMIAKGKNASDLFPAVVKNVVSKNVEIKKLVYVYLMRYAEEQQDLALLSISTFQRALKDPNQLIRASALRVLSSIRVPIITTIMMLAIKEAVSDMSPYVRKTAANAITKLYNLDQELKDELIEIIEKLLADKTILVAGSAIAAFEEVCPERIDLIHKSFRKLCNLLIDVDEWGQVIIINMLTRYARTQFLNPNAISDEESKNEEQNESEEEESEDMDSRFTKPMDPDHRLLLRVTKPLLQSRNSSVVMSVAQLYYYVAPRNEIPLVAKALVRLLRSHREVQIIVLKNIVSMAQKNQHMFQPHHKSFYVHTSDSIHVKILKLEILTCLANQGNISIILREFQTYVLSQDKEFAAATINAIGRCASTIKEVTDSCLAGLVNLMSKKDETIVGESVVVIKRLIQSNPSKNGSIIKRMAKMSDKVSVAMAKASILWLIGEYSDQVKKLAPDVLRKMAKTFCDEEISVKLQILNLAVKLFLTNQKQVAILVQYVLNLAKYDQSYDIRDRARFLRALIYNNEKCPQLAKHVKKIILAPKPAPLLESAYKDSDHFQLGTLSHAIGARVNGYTELPEFPAEAPDPSVRNIEVPVAEKAVHVAKLRKKSDKFYSDDDEEQKSQSTEGADPTESEESEESGSESDSETENDSENGSEHEQSEEEVEVKKSETETSEDSEESSSSSDSSSEAESETESEQESKPSKPAAKAGVKPAMKKAEKKVAQPANEVSLLDLDFSEPSVQPAVPVQSSMPILSPSLADLANLGSTSGQHLGQKIYTTNKEFELLNKISGNGLQIQYKFTRQANQFSNKAVTVELKISNFTNGDLNSFSVSNKKLQLGMSMSELSEFSLTKGASANQIVAIDFNDTFQPAVFELCAIYSNDPTLGGTSMTKKWPNLSITCPIGELIQPGYSISENEFMKLQARLKGMNEVNGFVQNFTHSQFISKDFGTKILEGVNVCQIPSSQQDSMKYAGFSASGKTPILLSLFFADDGKCFINVNCEKIVLANMLIKEVKQILTKV
ncbi:AP-3 complex subunit beta-2 [Brachionus plicatilis]|uniref:AP-3 complex subunit beta n=1 Tax=Brachionus plicatilis TaxID=10195 RepID=A0A3M7QKP9_BRAPC|nr:AP-3 complex subunit beta-2 [Brachionus plicatilis]